MSQKAMFSSARRGGIAVPNAVVHNEDLSYVAMALLIKSLAMKPDAPMGYRALQGRGLGESATRKALRELEEKGFRFRFRVRHEGKWRDWVVSSDSPIAPEDAYQDIVERIEDRGLVGAKIASCSSHPDFKIPSLEPRQNAEKDFARNFRQRGGEDLCLNIQAEVSEARQTTAQSHRDSNTSSLRSEVSITNQPEKPAVQEPPAAELVGRESQQARQAAPSVRRLDEVEQGLVDRMVPAPMRQVLDGSSALRIATALQWCVAEGWSEREVYNRLNNNPLPGKFAAGLVIHRVEVIRDTNPPKKKLPVPAPSPSRGGDSQSGPGQETTLRTTPPPEFFEELRRQYPSLNRHPHARSRR